MKVFLVENKKSKYILMVLFLYLFFILQNIPAGFVLSQISMPTNVVLSSVSGTLWKGNVAKVKYLNIDLGELSWKLHPLSLLAGNLSADVFLGSGEEYLKSEVEMTISGKIKLEETRFSMKLSSLQPLSYGMPMAYAGKIEGYLPVSYIQKNNYMSINGKVFFSNLMLLSPQEQLFGDFSLDMRAENDGATSGLIKNVAGPLELSGKCTLTKNGKFNLVSTIAVREADSELDNMLRLFSPKDSTGRFAFNYSLNLWN